MSDVKMVRLQMFFKCHNIERALMLSGREFYSAAGAVPINRLPSFTVLFLFGTSEVVMAFMADH